MSDKQSEDQNQQHQSSEEKSGKPELTAEWTVHAQLTISRPSASKTSKKFDTSDQQSNQNPVRVFYKWSSDDVKTGEDSGIPKSGSFRRESPSKGYQESCQSTTAGTKPPSESGFSSSNTSRKQAPLTGARCRSTCSIVLSAVADFLPSTADIPEEPDPFVFNTRTSYTVSPDKAYEDINASQNFAAGKILALRDAFSQTSDTEAKRAEQEYLQNLSSGSEQKDGRRRKPYDFRRHTDATVLPPTIEEGNSYLPSYSTASPAHTYTPPSVPQTVPIAGSSKTDQKKPPRTVHIDVYCTGSDAEDDGDDEDDSSSHSSSENLHEQESNSTPQTVLDTEQMLLRHQRAGRHELPRRFIASQQQPPPQEPVTLQNIGHAVTKSNTADEISESKQILFKKHIGDQRSKFNFRNRIFRKDPSDDCISSNYPNSSRSTMRDMTCSSISSAVPSNIYEDVETSWKETEPELTVTSLAKSDSFEYDNSIDRLRIRKMEQFWSRPEREYSETEEYKSSPSDSPSKLVHQSRIQEFLQSYRLPASVMRHHTDPLHLEYEVPSETDHSFPFDNITIPERDEPQDISPTSPITYYPPGKPRLELPPPDDKTLLKPAAKPAKRLFSPEYKSESEASTLQSNLSGYTSEYLAKARKFGTVVTALRKPGHHIGPAKNPECQCEHCRRWLAERVQGRGRAYSMGDLPTTRSGFWLKKAGLS